MGKYRVAFDGDIECFSHCKNPIPLKINSANFKICIGDLELSEFQCHAAAVDAKTAFNFNQLADEYGIHRSDNGFVPLHRAESF
jgi:hypothetical protein